MNFLNIKHPLIFALLILTQTLFGQEIALTKEYKQEVIETLSTLMNDFYIYPDVAKKTSAHLNTQFKNGHFEKYKENQAFAEALTAAVQNINKDKHMRIRANRPYEAPENSIERKTEERMDQINNYRRFNHGFHELRLLEGNVAYLDLRGFAGMQRAKEIADAYTKLMAQADAVIIDLSKNGGGSPHMVQYLCSYFFDQKLHLNSLYYREGDRTDEFWTLDEVGGKKMPDVPLFVITGERTFSGAEEFSYNMQTQKRATLIGQTSGGGANPGGTRRINEHLFVFIPTGRAINPITNTSWEGTGVVPEIKTTIEETFEVAHTMAQKAAEAIRKNKAELYFTYYKELNNHLEQYQLGKSETIIHNSIKSFVDSGLFGEFDINALGYEYLLNKNKPKVAVCILKSNTLLFPNSPNVFDSYGEALKADGDLAASLASYQKAIDIATKNNDPDLEFYKENFQKVKDEMEGSK